MNGAGINVYAIRPDIRLGDRRVPVNDKLLEGFLAKKEIIANPKKIRLALVLKVHPWPYACMDEIEIAATERRYKAFEKLAMVIGERLCKGPP